MGIGDLAKETGVKVVIIRYYGRAGVLRLSSGHQVITGLMAGTTSGDCGSCVGAAIWDSRLTKSRSASQ